MLAYPQLLKHLFSLNASSGIKLGLTNSLRLNAVLGEPAYAFPCIHVAGTNGKGSVVTKIASALQLSGLKVGLYTSPHIACFRERIQINGQMISENDVQRLLSLLFNLTEKETIPATFFELTTLMAFKYFADEAVDVVVIETGLGGRLDATNIVRPKLSIITSISLDHTELLGLTLEEIAREKGGIIKPGIPLVVGPCVPLTNIKRIADQLGSPVHVVSGEFATFNQENSAIAQAALELLNVPNDVIQKGIQALPRCRFEVWSHIQLSKNLQRNDLPEAVVMDVAHNPDALRRLLNELHASFPGKSLRFILGLSKSKDLKGCLEILKDQAAHFHLVESVNSRAAHTDFLKEHLAALQVPSRTISIEPSIEATINLALKQAAQKNEIVVICGTFFIMAEARAALNISEPRDLFDLN